MDQNTSPTEATNFASEQHEDCWVVELRNANDEFCGYAVPLLLEGEKDQAAKVLEKIGGPVYRRKLTEGAFHLRSALETDSEIDLKRINCNLPPGEISMNCRCGREHFLSEIVSTSSRCRCGMIIARIFGYADSFSYVPISD